MELSSMTPTGRTMVINIRTHQGPYINAQRPGPLGNPFTIEEYGSRENCIEEFRTWLAGTNHKNYLQQRRRTLINILPDLKGRYLGCTCHPLPCHASIICDFVDGVEEIVRY